MRWIIFVFLLLSACAHSQRAPVETMAYPFGVYKHQVTAQTKGDHAQSMNFQGIVQSEQHDFRVTGLSPLGNTVFKAHEDLCEKKTDLQVFVPGMDKAKDHFRIIFGWIKAGMFTTRDNLIFYRQGAKFALSNPDASGIPRRMEIDHERINIKIEVTDYELR